ncbi:MAG: tetratricopeptide repeat protein [Gammaproteobacteria bacterium]
MKSREARTVAACIAGCVTAWATGPAVAVTDAERASVNQQFREAFDARRYADALPFAERVVALTEEQYGKDNRALVNPLTNLGTVHYRLKDYPAAEKEYERSVEILESTAGNTDRQLLRPLQGLGAAHYAEQEWVDASVALKRAIDLSRNIDGLFNVEQLQILEPLIDSYVKLDLTTEAEKEQQYALRVSETAFGRTDPRMLKPLDRYGRWLEQLGRYTSARLLYARALTIAEQSAGRGTPLAIDPLLGIARSYRLEFVNGAEEAPASQDIFGNPDLGGVVPTDGARLNPDGERALRLALQAIEKNQPTDHRKRGETLVELGDWFMSAGGLSRGVDTYREAWKDFALAGDTTVLSAPRLLAYRPPPSSAKRSTLKPDEADERFVEVRFTVTKDGRTESVEALPSDASESAQRSMVSAFKKARYSPRFEAGEAVETRDVKFREKILVKAKQGAGAG